MGEILRGKQSWSTSVLIGRARAGVAGLGRICLVSVITPQILLIIPLHQTRSATTPVDISLDGDTGV